MANPTKNTRTVILNGFAIVGPVVVGCLCDLIWGCWPMLTFIGGLFSLCEAVERSLNRLSARWNQKSCMDKLPTPEMLEELLDAEDDLPKTLHIRS
jgi:hypothetical protein